MLRMGTEMVKIWSRPALAMIILTKCLSTAVSVEYIRDVYKRQAEAAENRRSEPLFPETELLLCPKKCVLILLWRLKVQRGVRAFLVIESDV